MKMGSFIWPLLAAPGKKGHFRLAAFGRSSSERVKEKIVHSLKGLSNLFADILPQKAY